MCFSLLWRQCQTHRNVDRKRQQFVLFTFSFHIEFCLCFSFSLLPCDLRWKGGMYQTCCCRLREGCFINFYVFFICTLTFSWNSVWRTPPAVFSSMFYIWVYADRFFFFFKIKAISKIIKYESCICQVYLVHIVLLYNPINVLYRLSKQYFHWYCLQVAWLISNIYFFTVVKMSVHFEC